MEKAIVFKKKAILLMKTKKRRHSEKQTRNQSRSLVAADEIWTYNWQLLKLLLNMNYTSEDEPVILHSEMQD